MPDVTTATWEHLALRIKAALLSLETLQGELEEIQATAERLREASDGPHRS